MKRIFFGVALAALVVGMGAARAAALDGEIDLTTFGEEQSQQTSVWGDESPIQEVASSFGGANRRFYASAMIGPSFSNIEASGGGIVRNYDDNLFAAGGALGVALDRRRGQLRLELEGMGRDTFTASAAPFGFVYGRSNWSVMGNAWRDFMFTERFGAYGGGGLGAGGYQPGDSLNPGIYYNANSAFAWQFGGGLIYEITERLTFDVGYRYFQIDKTNVTPNPNPIPVQTQFSASELMFTLRFYEPFRGLLN